MTKVSDIIQKASVSINHLRNIEIPPKLGELATDEEKLDALESRAADLMRVFGEIQDLPDAVIPKGQRLEPPEIQLALRGGQGMYAASTSAGKILSVSDSIADKAAKNKADDLGGPSGDDDDDYEDPEPFYPYYILTNCEDISDVFLSDSPDLFDLIGQVVKHNDLCYEVELIYLWFILPPTVYVDPVQGYPDCPTCLDPDAEYKLTPCVETGDNLCSGNCTTGDTPKYITATFSDTYCTLDCQAIGEPYNFWIKNLEGSLGTVLLTQDEGDSCLWVNASAGAWSYDVYGNDACTGAKTTTSGEWYISLRKKTPTTWSLAVSAIIIPFIPVVGFLNSVDETGTGSCIDIPEISQDEYQCGDVGFANAIAILDPGSTATFQAGDTEGGGRCPGGEPIYSDDIELAGYVGKVIHISESAGVCYQVSDNTNDEIADVGFELVTVTCCYDDCPNCCGDTNCDNPDC